MFAIIETKGATHIAINIPKEGADKSLPAIAAMLEHNAVFICKDWRDLKTVKPGMSIILGNTYNVESEEVGDLVIGDAQNVIDESFIVASPGAFLSNKKAMERKQAEVDKLRKDLELVRHQLADANERIEAMADDSQDEDAPL